MGYNTIDNFPDYLKDFEEIKRISEKIDYSVSLLSVKGQTMIKGVWFRAGEHDRWDKLLKKIATWIDEDEMGSALCFYQPVTTFTQLEEYIAAYLQSNDYTVEYDIQNMTVKIRTTDDFLTTDKVYSVIRKVVPMNLGLVIECVEEL